MLKDIISIASGFQSSVNIEYDFNDESKISGFIPTSSALSVINSILENTDNGRVERAKILTGAYGRGKSHIVLVALTVLYNKNADLFKKLIKKIHKLDSESAQRIENYISSKKRMLPVIINGNSGNLAHSFLQALQQALHNYELDDIMPETHFSAAVETIERWRAEYPDTFQKFTSMLTTDVDKYIRKLTMNDEEAYQTFVDLHPQLTAGSIFNPFVNANVVDVYDKVNTALKAKGYSGMYVVYDEFGKYLETSISRTTESEMKLLQDFAEKCDRESSQQLHLMLICHKDIANYIDDGLPKDKVDGWRGISGRFEHLVLSNNFHQMYEIISSTINKKKGWSDYYKQHAAVFAELLQTAEQDNYLSGKDTLVVNECYPLHPITTFLLPRLSERIAQNERTLFTFLTSNQKNTLKEFVLGAEDEFPIVTPDRLFDYFELELRKELKSSELHKIYILAARLLNQVDEDSLDARIIKSIAIIYCVQQFERVAPTVEMICNIYCVSYDRKEITRKIDELINQKYIVYRKNSTNFLCLKESSGTDINYVLDNKVGQLREAFDFESALNLCAGNSFLYPVKHNEEKCITRYFEFKFIRYQNLRKNMLPETKAGASGCVYAVIFESENDLRKALKEGKFQISDSRSIVIVPTTYSNIRDAVYRYLAAKELRDNCGYEDAVLRSEFDMITDDLETVIFQFIAQYTKPELGHSIYYYGSKEYFITRKSKLTELLSDICDKVYPHTPIVNNESINKDKLPGVAVTNRSKLTTAILENDEMQPNLGLTGTGQDVSFMRSTLIQTGVLQQNESKLSFSAENAEESIRYVLDVIRTFFQSTATEGERSLGDLYAQLVDYQYGIGMKKGAIPVYIAVVLHEMKKDLIIKSNGVEVKINSDTLNSINEKPNIFSVLMEDWDQDKKDFLSALDELFTDHIIEKERSLNSFSYIVSAMDRWYLALPKCAREMQRRYTNDKPISKKHKAFFQLLKAGKSNARDYLIIQLPNAFEETFASETVSDQIKSCKQELDHAKDELIKRVIREIHNIFAAAEGMSLNTLLTEWYESLSKNTVQNLFANNENAVLKLISTVTNDERMFAERIAKAVTGLRIDDWNNSILEQFIASLQQFKATVEEFDSTADQRQETKRKQYKIITINENGEEEVKSFDRVEYSRRAELLYRDITGAISDMGQSISEQEKRQVLFEILESLC